jgi:hypothetical protein
MSEAPARPRRDRGVAIALAGLLCLAAALRLVGITWGLPGERHLFSYQPDEYFSLQAALNLGLFGSPDPRFFNYPSLYLTLAAAAGSVAGHVTALGQASADQFPRLLRGLTLDARVVTVLLSLVTVLAAYRAARRIAGRAAGLCAAAAVAVSPGHVLYSHFAAVDVPLACFTTLSLCGALLLVDSGAWRAAALAGLAAAAATATKYNGVLAAAMPLGVLGMRVFEERTRAAAASAARQAAIVVAVLVVGFLVLSPYVALDWPKASRDISAETTHMRVGEPIPKAADPNGWLFHLRALGYSTGGCVVLLGYLGLAGWAVRRHGRRLAPAAVFAAIWFAVIGATGVRYARYGLPLVPLLAIAGGIAVADLLRSDCRSLRAVGIVAAALILVSPLVTSLSLSGSMGFEREPRDAALDALGARAAPGERVGLIRTVWFDMPPLDFDNGGDALGGTWREFHRTPYRLEVIGLDAARLRETRPPWFVETDFQIADNFRARDPQAVELWRGLLRTYRLEGQFRRRGGWWLLGPCGPPPHDWSYPFTTVRLWKER